MSSILDIRCIYTDIKFIISEIECPVYAAVASLVTVVGSGTSIGDTVTFHCPPGYFLSSNNTLLCNGDGQWEGLLPVCLGMFISL